MKIVVMGGSFNPPTIAHLRIMQTALDFVKAEIGFMVPVSFPYLKRKMVKAGSSHLALSDELRICMLQAMTASDKRIQVFTEAMGDPFSDDAGLMNLVQERYPDGMIYYVAGADKLDLLDHFAFKEDFFDRFCCILFAREGDQLTEEITRREHLAAHLSSFVIVHPSEGIEGISSTKVREHLFDMEEAADMVHPSVRSLLSELRREDFPEEILQFQGEYAFLSNDYPAEVTFEGLSYPCATSAYLASKCKDPAERQAISRMRPEKARQKYSAKAGLSEWEEQRREIMEDIVRLKFCQHMELMDLLMATGNRVLINGGKKDRFFGVNLITFEGMNHLGKILMNIRSERRTQ